MSKSDGSVYPPLPSDSDVRTVRGLLGRITDDDIEWACGAPILVGESVHLREMCYCPECREWRDATPEGLSAPSAKEREDIDLMLDEDTRSAASLARYNARREAWARRLMEETT